MEFLENRRSWENQKPPENRQKSGLFWASPFTMHLVCTLLIIQISVRKSSDQKSEIEQGGPLKSEPNRAPSWSFTSSKQPDCPLSWGFGRALRTLVRTMPNPPNNKRAVTWSTRSKPSTIKHSITTFWSLCADGFLTVQDRESLEKTPKLQWNIWLKNGNVVLCYTLFWI